MNGTSLSLAGVGIALAVAWANFRPWWKGTRDPKALIPYGAGLYLGSLATICIGGALGWGAAGIAGLASGGGDSIVAKLVGTGASQLGSRSAGTLTPAGGVAVALVAVGVGILFKASGKQDKRRIVGGLVTGSVLALLPGIATSLDWLPSTVNTPGAWAEGYLSGRSSL
ncbi:hypothetical protein [Streptomyces sp. NPDC050504]|uniref:hypothetical protein n=1 Tax=Streptomyces sp. NPDC050504 TaxID=3365618 RepID=UPI00378CBD52